MIEEEEETGARADSPSHEPSSHRITLDLRGRAGAERAPQRDGEGERERASKQASHRMRESGQVERAGEGERGKERARARERWEGEWSKQASKRASK